MMLRLAISFFVMLLRHIMLSHACHALLCFAVLRHP